MLQGLEPVLVSRVKTWDVGLGLRLTGTRVPVVYRDQTSTPGHGRVPM